MLQKWKLFEVSIDETNENFQVFLPPPLKPNLSNVRLSRESRQVCSLHASHARELPSVRRTLRCRRHIRRNRAPALHQVRHRPPRLFRPIGDERALCALRSNAARMARSSQPTIPKRVRRNLRAVDIRPLLRQILLYSPKYLAAHIGPSYVRFIFNRLA